MRQPAPAIVVLLSLATAGCSIDVRGDAIVVREERRFPAEGDLQLSLTTFDGSVEVVSWPREEVLVEIERRAATGAEAEALEVRTTAEGSRLTVDVPPPAGYEERRFTIGSRQNPQVNLRISAPRNVTLEARTGDGAVVASDIAGRISLRSADGAIRTERVSGMLFVDTADGAIVIRDQQGSIDLHTGDGAVDVSGTLDAVRVETADGAVRIEARQGSTISPEWTVRTGDGAISLRLPPELDADVDAYSGDGRISIAGAATAAPSRDDNRPAQVRASIGRGGPVIRLRTEDGAITVTR